MSEWIKCSERLPENSDDVIMYMPGFGVMNGYAWRGYQKNEKLVWKHANGEYEGAVSKEVTHWQPLPEPPQD